MRVRVSEEWTEVHVKIETRTELNIKKAEMGCKTIDELLNKVLEK